MVDLLLRERRRREAARRFRRRLASALALAVLAHLIGVPILLEVFRFEPGEAPRDGAVEVVQIPAAQWDAGITEGTKIAERSAAKEPRPRPPVEKKEPQKERGREREREKAPGQVVEVAPGNRELAPDARLEAETSNKVEKETIAEDRQAGAPVTMPRRTVDRAPDEQRDAAHLEDGAISLGEPTLEPAEDGGQPEGTIEIPSVERKDALSLGDDPDTPGGLKSQESSPGVEGNSNRFRVELGREGEPGKGESTRPGSESPGGLRLFPSGAVVDRIVGGPAPDHVEGMEEGDGTFLNTREWKHASFFNRVKKSVSMTWNPSAVLRVRDPSGNVYAWKDRVTLLSITLREDGTIAGIWVEKSSGVDFLDKEAIASFERAQPFPHPPRALADDTGMIRFSFGFHLQTSRPFRVFRRF